MRPKAATNEGDTVGDFSVDRAPEDCRKAVKDHLKSKGFTATPDGTESTLVLREGDARSGDDPSLWNTMREMASNVLLSSSSGRGGSASPRSVRLVVLKEGDETRLVVDASEPELQRKLDANGPPVKTGGPFGSCKRDLTKM
ncbi:MAG: hypothetical protein WA990_09615 [Rubrobacteraceae bacterium]